MKRYTLSGAASFTHVPTHPERTAHKPATRAPMDFDVMYQVWPNRASMARTIRMQQTRESHPSDWRACVKLTDGEGY